MRITEIMTDFRNLQHYIAQVTVTPTAEEYNLEGYRLLRACQREAQQLLNEPFNTPAGGPAEESTELMVQLRRYVLVFHACAFESELARSLAIATGDTRESPSTFNALNIL